MNNLPLAVQSALNQSSESHRAMFEQEYNARKKSVAFGYFASLMMLHYAYTGRIGMSLLSWLIGAMTLGISTVIWWTIDLFRIPGLIRAKNNEIAIAVLRDQRIIMGGGM